MKRFLLFSTLFLLLAVFVSAAQASRKPVRLAYLQGGGIHQLACMVAIEKGFFKEEGLQVEVAGTFMGGPEEMNAFAAGALDAGYVGEAPATTAVANGTAQVTALAQVNIEGSAVVVGVKSGISRMQDLAGKVVAIPGYSTVQDFLLRKALAQAGMKPESVSMTVLKHPDMISALSGKQIDAFIAGEPYPTKAETMGVGRLLISSRDIWKNHPCCVLVVDNRFLAKHHWEAQALVRAHVKATDFINSHPEEAALIAAQYTGMDMDTIKAAMKRLKYTYALSIEGEKEYVVFLTRLKYIKVIDPDAFVRRFINEKIIEKITNE